MEDKEIYAEISSIRNLMERSTKFISLSGLSGVMAGVYALIGAAFAYKILYLNGDVTTYFSMDRTEGFGTILWQLSLTGLIVLTLSITTGILLTVRKARKNGLSVINPSSKALLVSGGIPLVTGGIFAIILLMRFDFGIISSTCLIFYGLALVAASQHTFGDVKWLGIFEIILGLLALTIPGYGLYIWAFGFGVLHILYGTIMHFKYDRK
ncbi:hypothetical protein KXQ82_13130 [Mucilaginibacter sp. HMF5004]|uniref:hypothetical protein n=1 Tax=Mucilaginibacter rivuli TaxID=2857527 RepID=UPI001C5F17A2|nr:hypothetical protein [Mucilaginibacter rivuli]MBW4890672.1 hypothetical protein [Mucilaginibacter rivuli]